MKISRQRKVKRYLNFYKNNFHFRNPFQVLIDSTFCHEALKCKVNIKEQMPKYLEDPSVRLFTTPCVIMEAELLGPKIFGAMLIVKQFKARKCGHEKNPRSAAECLLSLIKDDNTDHYIIATQDRELTEKCREIPGVPVMYIGHNAINLEKPSTLNNDIANEHSKAVVENSDYQTAVLKKLKKEVLGEEEKPKKRKRKGPKEPNPLSCKKKKVKQSMPQPEKKLSRKRHKRNKKVNMPTTAPVNNEAK